MDERQKPIETMHEFTFKARVRTPRDGMGDKKQIRDRINETHAHLRDQLRKAAEGLIGTESTSLDEGSWGTR